MDADNGDIWILVNLRVGAQMQSQILILGVCETGLADQQTCHLYAEWLHRSILQCKVDPLLSFFPPLIDPKKKALCNVRINKEYSCKHTV